MRTLLQDMRYGLRVLWKSPGFAIVAVLSLALGVGANTAIFSIVNAVLLRSLPFSHPERLVKIVASNRGVGARDIGLSVPEFDDLRSRAGVFDQVAATQGGPTNLTGGERPQRFELLEVSPNYFSLLGISARIGRVFGPGDEAPGFAEAAVISDGLWAREFGRDPGVLGRKIQLDNDPYTVVGVLPPAFRHPVSARPDSPAEVQVDWTVLLFALLVSLLAGLGFGLVPALQSSKAEIAVAIREGARGSGTSAKTNRLRGLLIASETALAVVLMVAAGLLLRTFLGLLQENPGFNPSRIVAANFYLPVPNNPEMDRYAKPEFFNAFVRETVRRVGALPGIDHSSLTTDLPVAHLSWRAAVNLEDRPDESGKGLVSEVTSVTPEYLNVLQASLVRGRYFTEADDLGKLQVAIVDESTARTYWPDRDPIGRRLSIKSRRAGNPPWCTVVGVIKDINADGLDQSGAPHIYRPIYQFRGSRVLSLSVTVRTSLSATSLEPQIRREIQAVDPNLPVFNVRTMNEVIDGSLASRRFSAELVGLFAMVALLLASVGIYGLLAYMVGQRSHEIGVRMALGAMPSTIARMIVRRGAGLAGVGVGIGLILSGIMAPLISSVLYGVGPLDPEVFIAVPVIIMVIVLVASYIPAWRAARVNPIVAMRRES